MQAENRDFEGLAGASEHSARAAEDQQRASQRRPEGARAPRAEDDDSVPPDELGRRFLERATGDVPEAVDLEREADERPVPSEVPATSTGERVTRRAAPGGDDTTERLTSEMPDRTEHEEKVSKKTRRMQKEDAAESNR